jgi:hypothetical protein
MHAPSIGNPLWTQLLMHEVKVDQISALELKTIQSREQNYTLEIMKEMLCCF